MVIRNFVITLFLFTTINITFTYQARSSDIDDAMESDTGAPNPKKRKLDTDELSENNGLVNLLYEQAKDLIQVQNLSRQPGKLDNFLKDLGITYRDKVIERLVDAYEIEKLKEHSQLISQFLNERARVPYTLHRLNDFKNAFRIGYKKFSYKPSSNNLREVLAHLALARSLISSLWASRSYEDQNRSFIFEIPTPLSGTAESGQLGNLVGSPFELRFSSNCLDLSHAQLTSQLLNEFASLQSNLNEKFSTLKLDEMSIADGDFQILHPFLFRRGFSSLSCDGNQLTSKSLNWMVMTLCGDKRNNSGPSTLSLRNNNIIHLNNLGDVFLETYAPRQERSQSSWSSSRIYGQYEREEEPRYEYSSLDKLDLSGNPFTKDEITLFLQAFIKPTQPSSVHDFGTFNYQSRSPYSETPLFFSRTTIVLKEISSLDGSEQEIKDWLTKNQLMFKVIFDDAFMPSK